MWNKLNGFGLIEVMVAFLITSVGIVGIFQVRQLIIFQDDEISHRTHALAIARTCLEDIHAGRPAEEAEAANVADERYQVVIVEQPADQMDGLWLVLVTVSWDDLREKHIR